MRLLITCPDRPGIVAVVSNFLAARGANITESQQYSTDPFGGTFFLRLEFHTDGAAESHADLAAQFAELADKPELLRSAYLLRGSSGTAG